MVTERSEPRQKPFYVEGQTRDPRIEAMQDEGYQRADFMHLLRKVEKPVRNGTKASRHDSAKHGKPSV
jgi:hypothetical protein